MVLDSVVKKVFQKNDSMFDLRRFASLQRNRCDKSLVLRSQIELGCFIVGNGPTCVGSTSARRLCPLHLMNTITNPGRYNQPWGVPYRPRVSWSTCKKRKDEHHRTAEDGTWHNHRGQLSIKDSVKLIARERSTYTTSPQLVPGCPGTASLRWRTTALRTSSRSAPLARHPCLPG